MEHKSYTNYEFLDFTACFDTLNRNILFSKFYRYGIGGVGLNLTESYSADREQSAHIENFDTDMTGQNLKVIQASKSRSLSFDICLNKLNYIHKNDENIMFADDIYLTYIHKNLETLESNVNTGLVKILD